MAGIILPFSCKFLPSINVSAQVGTRSVICNPVVAIPDDNGKRKKTCKLSPQNRQDITEEYSVPLSFYCVCVFDGAYSAGAAFFNG